MFYFLIILFWLSAFLIFYAYAGYPITLLIVNKFAKNVIYKKEYFPHVTLIIAAYNEEKRIKKKIENSVKLEYPPDKLQIIIASDGSKDSTNSFVKEYQKKYKQIELLEIKERKGKENAQQQAVFAARGEILVFSDVATILEIDGIKNIVANFADTSIGCVSSEDRIIDELGNVSGEGAYVRYEMWLRRLESRVYSLVGLSGSFFAARKEVCQNLLDEVHTDSDFKVLLNSIQEGLRGISDPESIGIYQNIADEKREFERKIRTILRGITGFFNHSHLLNIFRYGFFSYEIFCHKLLRWLVPFCLISTFISSFLLSLTHPLYLFMFLLQFIFYLVGFWGWKMKNEIPENVLVKIPMFFLIVNVAIIISWFRFLQGERIVVWTPSQR